MTNLIKQYLQEVISSFSNIKKAYVTLKIDISGVTYDAIKQLLHYRNVCLTGSPGAGKTTILRYLAITLCDSYDQFHCLPIFVPARNLPKTLIRTSLKDLVEKYATPHAYLKLFNATKQLNHMLIILDGLDEMILETQLEFKRAFLRWCRKWPSCSWIFSTRSYRIDIIPENFKIAEICPLGQVQIQEILSKRYSKHDSAKLITSFNEIPLLKQIIRNPLVLNLLLRSTEELSLLPKNKTEIYSSFVDLVLRIWDKERGISSYDSKLSSRMVSRITSLIALQMFKSNSNSITHNEISKIIAKEIRDIFKESNLSRILRTSFISISKYSFFEFTHKSIQEYFTALALVSLRADETAEILSKSVSDSILEFIANLSNQPDLLILRLIDRGKIDIAVHLIDFLPPEHHSVRLKFLKRVADRIGLNNFLINEKTIKVESTKQLYKNWKKCKTINSAKKGKALEDFIEKLFCRVFNIVSKNTLTKHGEIDLICEQKGMNAFWMRWPSDFFVECKNRRNKSTASDISKFLGKASLCNARLCFFVSISGFSTYALRGIETSWSKTGIPDIVWIEGKDLEKWFNSDEEVEPFLKRMNRRSHLGYNWYYRKNVY